jgi:hypothetical protein
VSTHLEGYQPDVREVPVPGSTSMWITLTPLQVRAGILYGWVVDEEGHSVPGVRVSTGDRTLLSDAQGEFQFDEEVRRTATLLMAAHPGHLPARVEAEQGAHGPLWPDFVVLRLGGATLEIAGRVRDASGEALAGIRVWIADPTPFGMEDDVPIPVENVTAGRRPKSAIQSAGEDARHTPNSFWSWSTTDAEGRFRIGGLLDRTYRLQAMDFETLQIVETRAVRAGTTDVEIELPKQECVLVAGRTVTHDGEPVAGVELSSTCAAWVVEREDWGIAEWDVNGPQAITDEDGAFVLGRLPREGVWLFVVGEGIRGQRLELAEIEDPKDATIVVERIPITRPCHVRLELSGERARAETFRLVDAEGEAISLTIRRGGYALSSAVGKVVDGVSLVYGAAPGDYELVLHRGEEELARSWVTLLPGEVNTLN